MSKWVADPNRHVRRLVSEGTRPRLPWGIRLTQLVADPAPTLPLLKALRDDTQDIVRRSVANHLNDISKDHPDLVADIARAWMPGADKNRERLLRHACRTLIKQGHGGALAAFGINSPRLELGELSVETEVVEFGGALAFTANISSVDTAPQELVSDYVLHFRKANGTRTGKVFKWKNVTLKAGAAMSLTRSHPIRPITTRRYYQGRQAVSLRINGRDFGFAEFDLQVPGQM